MFVVCVVFVLFDFCHFPDFGVLDLGFRGSAVGRAGFRVVHAAFHGSKSCKERFCPHCLAFLTADHSARIRSERKHGHQRTACNVRAIGHHNLDRVLESIGLYLQKGTLTPLTVSARPSGSIVQCRSYTCALSRKLLRTI